MQSVVGDAAARAEANALDHIERSAQFGCDLAAAGSRSATVEWTPPEPKPAAKPRKPPGKTIHRVGVQAHRNDPCPCGSGKKFKRCCRR
jgi:uncharacterized protein YecA (UPF0149 family)